MPEKKVKNGHKALKKNGDGLRVSEQPKRIGRPPKYPWDKWFEAVEKGRSVVVKHGEDFDCEVPSMITLARNTAKKRGLSLSLRIKGQSISISKE